VSTRTDHDWETSASGVTAGAAYTVEYLQYEKRLSAIIVYLYSAWDEEKPGKFWVQRTFERIHGEDPGDPVRSETWSDSGHAVLPGEYRTEGEAAAAAEQLAALLASCDYAALDAIAPGVYRDPLTWDGIPYDTEPDSVP